MVTSGDDEFYGSVAEVRRGDMTIAVTEAGTLRAR